MTQLTAAGEDPNPGIQTTECSHSGAQEGEKGILDDLERKKGKE